MRTLTLDAVVMGVFVAYAAMFGFDKLRQTLEQLDSIKRITDQFGQENPPAAGPLRSCCRGILRYSRDSSISKSASLSHNNVAVIRASGNSKEPRK